uniref:Arachidonate 5-lipoxygenase n=1 Tax=Sphenodon punctatus TaxID=8508 RepID=A0A8D0HKQ9_SPHPU
MSTYKVRVGTGHLAMAGTYSSIFITLVGTRGESPKQPLNSVGRDFVSGAVDEYKVSSDRDVGPLILIRLHKERYLFFPEDSWYCSFVQVMTPEGETYHFPSYQWMEGYCTLTLREGSAKTINDDAGDPQLLEHRKEELRVRKEAYSWKEYAPGWPRCIDVESVDELDSNSKYSITKTTIFALRAAKSEVEVRMKGFYGIKDSCENLNDIRRVFWFHRTPVTEYVADHWMEDAFFGYQYLKGVNPVVLRKCTKIPANFPVTQEMVAKSLGESTTLEKELQKGNIFLTDYKILEDIPGWEINGEPQYVAAPLCLLHLTPENQMMPLAIQVSTVPLSFSLADFPFFCILA